jgi:hypothetical protein
MKLSLNISGLIFLAAAISGCATTHRASIVMKMSESEAHISMGQGEVVVGDHVELYRNVCTKSGSPGERAGGGPKKCEKQLFGHGEISQLLGNDYAVVKFPAGIAFSEGDTVEKHIH